MQLLKGAVVGLGVLIMLAGGLLAYGLYQKSQDPGWRLFSSAPTPAPAPSAAKPFGALNLNLPEGCVIARVRPDANLAYLTIGPSGACNRIVVVNIATGRVLGTIQPGK